MAKKVVTFGEIMLRLAPEGYYRFVQAASYGATYGGGEANVAISLANYGMDASFVTKLPAAKRRHQGNIRCDMSGCTAAGHYDFFHKKSFLCKKAWILHFNSSIFIIPICKKVKKMTCAFLVGTCD